MGASLLVGSRRLGPWYGLSIAFWGVSLVAGTVAHESATLSLLAIIGLANAVLDVSGLSVMARLAPDEVLARAFGIFESLIALTIGLGSIVAPIVVGAVGVRGALVCIGSLCPVLAASSWLGLRSIDASMRQREAVIADLRCVPMLRPLPAPVMDHVGRYLTRTRVRAGEAVFRQGDAGDRFYVIAAGEADVLVNGRPIRTLSGHESFGEIALLRDVPRTAEVRARSALDLCALDRDDFVLALDGCRHAAAEAEAAISRILGPPARWNGWRSRGPAATRRPPSAGTRARP